MTIDHEKTDEVLAPIHPGEVLREEFMVPLNLTAYGVDPQVWLTLQNRFDMETAKRAVGPQADRIAPLRRDAA